MIFILNNSGVIVVPILAPRRIASADFLFIILADRKDIVIAVIALDDVRRVVNKRPSIKDIWILFVVFNIMVLYDELRFFSKRFLNTSNVYRKIKREPIINVRNFKFIIIIYILGEKVLF